MRPILLFSAVAFAAGATPASAQNPPSTPAPAVQAQRAGIKLSDVAGTWEGKSMVGPKDSVVVTYMITATADPKGWAITFPGRPGQTVTTRTTSHYTGDTATGTFEAHYASGDVIRGKVVATRKK
ncbi:MAG: hypothetical protein DMD41_12405 [Gemmatimonadetes bacterium]|nr:MAG: hypothetical protein DMD41_12405 [Gemmatimonadota bacterium]